MPEDFNLTVRLLNKDIFKSEIGRFEIDLEDRLYGCNDVRKIFSYHCWLDHFTRRLSMIGNRKLEKIGKKSELSICKEAILRLESLIDAF